MSLFRDHYSQSDADIQHTQRWLHLRALEWSNWPAFISQPIVPILFIFYPWLTIVITLVCIDFLWRFVRYSFVNIRLSVIAVYFVYLKWPVALISTIYLLIHGRYVLAIIALLWPLLAGLVGFPVSILVGLLGRQTPFPQTLSPLRRFISLLFGSLGVATQIGRIELAFAKKLGYMSKDVEL